jgi:hypothetical protein
MTQRRRAPGRFGPGAAASAAPGVLLIGTRAAGADLREDSRMAKTYEGDELATRVFGIVMVGVGAAIAAMFLIGL